MNRRRSSHSDKRKSHAPEFRSAPRQAAPRDAASSPELVYGKNPLREILKVRSRRVLEVLATRESVAAIEKEELGELIKAARVPISLVEAAQLHRLVPNAVHQNIVARVERFPYATLDDVLAEVNSKALILALDCVQDPQNFATLARTALSFGVSVVILPKDRSVTVTGAVCKASSGAVEHLKIAQVVNLARALEELKDKGFWIYGTSLAGEPQPLPQIDPAPKSVLVLGSEGEGIRSLVAKTCDVLVKIPMAADFDSLNVAQAGAVCLYDFARKMALV